MRVCFRFWGILELPTNPCPWGPYLSPKDPELESADRCVASRPQTPV
uniref:Uncharacterized protein n=1 Tax=Anguilla anguilla TaxID=7936 RepID=A0A0E9T970_ANGAN